MNHDGGLGNARRLIEAAAASGADVVKFQVHVADAETLPDAPSPAYFTEESRYAYFRRTAFTPAQWRQLKQTAEAQGIAFLASVFSREAVDLLDQFDVGAYKVPSGEVTNLPLLEHLAARGKPVYLSSGMSTWEELDAAVRILRRAPLTVLQCTSEYPCAYEHVGLNVMEQLKARYQVPVGLSDHTMTNYAAFAAVALGACVIEKHLTLSRRMYGSDAKHSLEPEEFADLARGIRAIETMVASPVQKDAAAPAAMKAVFEKSVVAVTDIPSGAQIRPEMVGLKKPGSGIPPSQLGRVVGRTAARRISAQTLIRWDDLAEGHGA